jgi:hypothetical protein
MFFTHNVPPRSEGRLGEMTTRKNRGGRPSRKLRAGERVPLSFRVPPDLKRALNAAANRDGRSQSQEAELRLDRTFREEELLPQVLGLAYGADTAAILSIFGELINAVAIWTRATDEGLSGSPHSWLDEPRLFGEVVTALNRVLAKLRPTSEPSPRQSYSGFADGWGQKNADAMLDMLAAPSRSQALLAKSGWAGRVRIGLGSAVQRISPDAEENPQ